MPEPIHVTVNVPPGKFDPEALGTKLAREIESRAGGRPAPKRPMSSRDRLASKLDLEADETITGNILGSVVGGALVWSIRTSVVVLTLKAWGVIA